MKMIILVDICKYIILCDVITLLKANRISKLKYSIDLKYCRQFEMKKKYISLFLVILLGMIFNISNIKAYEGTNDVIGQTKFVDKDGNISSWAIGHKDSKVKSFLQNMSEKAEEILQKQLEKAKDTKEEKEVFSMKKHKEVIKKNKVDLKV